MYPISNEQEQVSERKSNSNNRQKLLEKERKERFSCLSEWKVLQMVVDHRQYSFLL